jgi:metal-responsive CopG/Arc/MetJ family transcriptional regulator
MKTIQVSIDEKLLAELDSCEEVKEQGRSAILRRAVAQYLRRRTRTAISEQYRRAYAAEGGLGEEFSDWDTQGQWPDS